MRIRTQALLAGLAVVAGAGLLGGGIARQLPHIAAHPGYIFGGGALAIGAAALLAAVSSLFRNS